MHKIGYIQKNRYGIPTIVFGNQIVREGLSYARYEINDCVDTRRLRIDGIIATDPKRVKQLLDKMENIARNEGCGLMSYIDDTPTNEEIAIFTEAGYTVKDYDGFNINIKKVLSEKDYIKRIK